MFVSLLFLFIGLIIIATSPLAQNETYTIGAVILGLVMIVPSIWLAILYAQNKTVISKKNITSYRGKKPTKNIDVDKLKRVVVYKVEALYAPINKIVLDDGTFKESVYPSELFFINSVKTNSWISIDYTHQKLKLIKKTLPNKPFVEIKTSYNQFQK